MGDYKDLMLKTGFIIAAVVVIVWLAACAKEPDPVALELWQKDVHEFERLYGQ